MKNLVVLVVVSLLSISTVARADDSESGPSNNVVKLSAQRSEVKPENLKCITRGDFYLRIGGRVVLRDTLRGVDLFSSAFGSGYGDVHHNDVMSECLNTIAAARASQKFTPFTGEFFSSGSQTVG